MGKEKLLVFESQAPCLAMTEMDVQCKNSVREADQISATRLIHKTYNPNVAKDSTTDSGIELDIVDLLTNGTHQGKSRPSQALLTEYREKFTKWALHHSPLTELDVCRSSAGSKTSVANKLLQRIKNEEIATGGVYAFTCLDLPGMIKVGYVRSSSSATRKRLREWGKCHSKPKVTLEESTEFPHRVEELVQCELVGKRYDVACPVTACRSSYHNEWFKCSTDEVKSIISQWVVLMNEHALYDRKSRQLDVFWKRVVQGPGEGVGITAQELMSRARIKKLTRAMEATSLE